MPWAISIQIYWNAKHLNTPLFIDAAILPVSFMYYKTVASLMHDINSNNSPTNLFNLFSFIPYNWLSTSGNFHVKSSKLEIHKNSLSRFGVRLWNKIPCHIRDLPKKRFTKVLHRLLSGIFKREDDFMETSLIAEKVRLTVKWFLYKSKFFFSHSVNSFFVSP